MNRIEINLSTGAQMVVPLTAEEIDDAQVRTAAEQVGPIRLRHIADTDAANTAKADTVVQFLRDHTPTECQQYVQDNVTDLPSARALMKKFAVVLCVLAKQSLR